MKDETKGEVSTVKVIEENELTEGLCKDGYYIYEIDKLTGKLLISADYNLLDKNKFRKLTREE